MDKLINPQPVLEFAQEVEQSIFIFKLFQNSIETGDGRVAFVSEKNVVSRQTILGH